MTTDHRSAHIARFPRGRSMGRMGKIRRSAKSAVSTAVTAFDQLLITARSVTVSTFAATLAATIRDHGVSHAARNIGRTTKRRIVDFQNWTFDQNREWQLTDVQMLFVWRAEFPAASGAVFAAEPARGLGIFRAVRSEYNRSGHGSHGIAWHTNPTPIIDAPETFPRVVVDPVTATIPAPVPVTKRTARKSR